MPHTARGPGRAPRRRHSSSPTEPLRIHIDKRPTNWTDAYSCVWYVSPVERDIHDVLDFVSYELEIRMNGLIEGGMRIKRIAHRDGEQYETLTAEEFDERVDDILQHEEDVDPNGASDMLTSRGIWPEASMRTFGFRLDYFDRMEAAWRAAQQFLDFGYTDQT